MTCSCFEIAGEDPRCIRHGEGTKWRKENPDICEMSERLKDQSAEIESLTKRVAELVSMLTTAREAIASADEDAFGEGVYGYNRHGEPECYPLRAELLGKIDAVLVRSTLGER